MKTAALILGLLGGIGGFIGALFALIAGGLGTAFNLEGAETIVGLGWAAIPLSLLGIVGGAITIARPKGAGIMMLISGIGGFIAISAGYLFGGPLLIVGGVLALLASRSD